MLLGGGALIALPLFGAWAAWGVVRVATGMPPPDRLGPRGRRASSAGQNDLAAHLAAVGLGVEAARPASDPSPSSAPSSSPLCASSLVCTRARAARPVVRGASAAGAGRRPRRGRRFAPCARELFDGAAGVRVHRPPIKLRRCAYGPVFFEEVPLPSRCLRRFAARDRCRDSSTPWAAPPFCPGIEPETMERLASPDRSLHSRPILPTLTA